MPKHPWFKPRHYLHFDIPVSKKAAEEYVSDPRNVSTHAFYPFLNFIVESPKYKKNPETGLMTKDSPKKRPISYAAHLDSQIYSYYSYVLKARHEDLLNLYGLGSNIIAFRTLCESNIDFAKRAFDIIKGFGECDVYGLDISKFFDTMDHGHLKAMWELVMNVKKLPGDHYAVYKAITAFSIVEKEALFEKLNISTHNPKNGRIRICSIEDFRNVVRKSGLISQKAKVGMPQGSPMSAILSNMYMLSFDLSIKKLTDDIGGYYFRYCDDILIIVPPDTADVENFAINEIKKIKLSIQTAKSLKPKFRFTVDGVLKCDKDLQYLGFMFDGVSPWLRPASLAKYSSKVNKGLKLAKWTMVKANGKRVQRGEPQKELFKKLIYKRYSYLGRRNFITYGLKAAKVMESNRIKKQIRPLWKRLQSKIEKI